eukprot:COSAG01_NODE_4403_length_5060_cov_15.005644_4_plen_72_part_00
MRKDGAVRHSVARIAAAGTDDEMTSKVGVSRIMMYTNPIITSSRSRYFMIRTTAVAEIPLHLCSVYLRFLS